MAAYQPLQMPGGSGDFGDAFDRILRARQASQQAEQHRAEMLLRQQELTQRQGLQNAQIQNYQSEASHRTALESAASEEQKQRRLGEFDAVTKQLQTLAQTDPAAAADIARRHGIEGWQSQQPKPPEFPAAPARRQTNLPTGLEYGPRRDPMEVLLDKDPVGAEAERARFEQANDQGTDFAANRQANQDAETANQQDDKRFGDAKAAFTGQMAAFSKELPTYTGTHREFGAVNVDPNAPERGRKLTMERTREQLAPLTELAGMDPAARQRMNARIAAGADAKTALNETMQEMQAQHKIDSEGKYKLTADQQYRIGMDRNSAIRAGKDFGGGGGGNGDGRPLGALDPKVLNPLEQGVNRFQGKFGTAEDRNAVADLTMQLNNSKDPVIQRAMAYKGIARGLAGEKGPLSKDDVTRLNDYLGGAYGAVETWIEKYKTGAMGAKQEDAVVKALGLVLKEKQKKQAGAQEAWNSGVLHNPAYLAYGPTAQAYLAARTEEIFGPGTAAKLEADWAKRKGDNPLTRAAGAPKGKNRLTEAHQGSKLDAIEALLGGADN